MFLDKNVSKLVCWYMKSVDVIAFCTIFSLDMKALPVTISWLWSRFIIKLSLKFVQTFSENLYKIQISFLACDFHLSCTRCLLNLL